MNRVGILGVGVLVGVLILNSALFVVHQAEQALVVRLGAYRGTIKEPGLHFKVPFIEDVVRYDARLLDVDPPPEQVLLADQKRIEVDTLTRFRIDDPLRFYQSVRTEEFARQRLREIVNASLRRVLGNVMLPSILSEERAKIIGEIQAQVNTEAKPLGISVTDVRIRRADLPEETSQAIYDRMKSERERIAREVRAQGQERSQLIRSRAERERTVILAEAQKQAQVLRGQGEGDANRAYAQSFGQDPQFFSFWRSLQAYRATLTDGNTSMVLSPDDEFFRFFRGMEPRR